MASIIATLKNSYTAKEIRSGYHNGHYSLEETVLECLAYLEYSKENENTKTEAIMVFLHE